MYCNKCGYSIDNFSLYCSHCGTKNRFAAATIYAKEFKNGNRDSFNDLYNESYPTVLNAIEGKFENQQDIEDCIQRVYMKVYDKIDQYDDNRPFLTWIYTVAKNTAIDELRKQGKKQEYKEIPISYTEDEEEKELDLISCYDEFNPTAEIDKSEKDDIIKAIMRSLPESSKECILLMYTEGFKIKDIASMLEVDEGTVKSRLYYGRKIVKERVLEYQSNGLKLYSMSPFVFFIWLLKASKAEASGEYVALGSKICNDILSSANTANIADSVNKKITSANEVVKEATENSVINKATKITAEKAVTSVISKKVVAIIAAIAVTGVAVTGIGLALSKNDKTDKENVEQVVDNEKTQETEQKAEEDIIVPDDKLEEKYAPVLDAYKDYIENGKINEEYITLDKGNKMLGIEINNENKSGFQYTFYDLNGDGKKELLISILHNDTEALYPSYYLTAIYSYDNKEVFKVNSTFPDKFKYFMYVCINEKGYIECNVDGDSKLLYYSLSEDGRNINLSVGSTNLSGYDTIFYFYEDESEANKLREDYTEEEITNIKNNPNSESEEKFRNIASVWKEDFEWIPFNKNITENIAENWKQLYIDKITTEHKEDQFGGNRYYIVDIDGVEPPEIYVTGNSEAEGSKLFTCYNNTIKEIQLAGSCSLLYNSGTTYFQNSGGRMGGYFDKIFKLEKGVFEETLLGEYNEHVEGNSVNYIYYIDENEVTEDEYRKKIKEYVNNPTFVGNELEYTLEEAIAQINNY